MKKLMVFFMAFLLFLPQDISNVQAKSLVWDGSEIVPGQIGKMTFKKDAKVYKNDKNGKFISMVVKRNHYFRVYNSEKYSGHEYLWMSGGYRVSKTDLVIYKEIPRDVYAQLNGTTYQNGDYVYVSKDNTPVFFSFDKNEYKKWGLKKNEYTVSKFTTLKIIENKAKDGWIKVSLSYVSEGYNENIEALPFTFYVQTKNIESLPKALEKPKTIYSPGEYSSDGFSFKEYEVHGTLPNGKWLLLPVRYFSYDKPQQQKEAYIFIDDAKNYANYVLEKPQKEKEQWFKQLNSPDTLFSKLKGDFTYRLLHSTSPSHMKKISENVWESDGEQQTEMATSFEGNFTISYTNRLERKFVPDGVQFTHTAKSKEYIENKHNMNLGHIPDFYHITTANVHVPFPLKIGSVITAEKEIKFYDPTFTTVLETRHVKDKFTVTVIAKHVELEHSALFALPNTYPGKYFKDLVILGRPENKGWSEYDDLLFSEYGGILFDLFTQEPIQVM